MSGTVATAVPLSKISPAFLHSNSTSHTWAFSAIAELIDNAYDPDVGAREIQIDKAVINGKICLTFEDNGNGMDHSHLLDMLSLGFCEKAQFDEKPSAHKPIGKYGNGFKSGSMRLAKDALVFTVCKHSASVGFLSRTYLQETHSNTVRVPMVEYSLPKLEPVSEDTKTMLSLICEFSPYSEEREIKDELEYLIKHPRKTGTKIVLFNLKRHKNGIYELDFESDNEDIRNPEAHELDLSTELPQTTQNETSEYLSSLRSYCSILFLKPRMQIYIRGVKVKTTLVSESLSRTEKDRYKPSWMPKPLCITFGFVPRKNAHSTDDFGIMFYHRNRLIKAYEKVGYQKQPNELGLGVVGVVHNADFLTTTHNKQDFVKDEKYNSLLANLGHKLNAYWDAKKGTPSHGANSSTEEPDWLWAQCDECLKWRRLPELMKKQKLPDKWYCRMNPDPTHNRCDTAEESHLEGEYTITKCTYNKTRPQARRRQSRKSSDSEAEANANVLAARVIELEETLRRSTRPKEEPQRLGNLTASLLIPNTTSRRPEKRRSVEQIVADVKREKATQSRVLPVAPTARGDTEGPVTIATSRHQQSGTLRQQPGTSRQHLEPPGQQSRTLQPQRGTPTQQTGVVQQQTRPKVQPSASVRRILETSQLQIGTSHLQGLSGAAGNAGSASGSTVSAAPSPSPRVIVPTYVPVYTPTPTCATAALYSLGAQAQAKPGALVAATSGGSINTKTVAQVAPSNENRLDTAGKSADRQQKDYEDLMSRFLNMRHKIHIYLSHTIEGFSCREEKVESVLTDLIQQFH